MYVLEEIQARIECCCISRAHRHSIITYFYAAYIASRKHQNKRNGGRQAGEREREREREREKSEREKERERDMERERERERKREREERGREGGMERDREPRNVKRVNKLHSRHPADKKVPVYPSTLSGSNMWRSAGISRNQL